MGDPGVQEWQNVCRLHFDGKLDGGLYIWNLGVRRSTGLGPEAELSACHTSSRMGWVTDNWTVLSAPRPP